MAVRKFNLHGESRDAIHRSSAADAAALLPLGFEIGRGDGWRRPRERGLVVGRAVAAGAVVLAAGAVGAATVGGDVLALDFGFLTTLLGVLAE